jgi:hypothetical protein
VIVSVTSVDYVTRDDYLQADKNPDIEDFNHRLEALLDGANFTIAGDGERSSTDCICSTSMLT